MSELKTTFDYAQYYLLKGFSVIPLKHKDKIPALPSWKEFQQRYSTQEEIKKWFSNGDNNIGIVAGKISGLTVIDLDSPAAATFAKQNFTPTPRVKTSKCFHLYYRYREGIRNFQKRDDLPDIDLRGDGGYVVAPPSLHQSGKQYKWLKNLEDLPLTELPQIILPSKPEHIKQKKEIYNGVSLGTRNTSLTKITGSLLKDGLTLEECLEFAFFWNQKNSPPLPEHEVIKTIKSIFENHQNNLSKSPVINNRQLDNKIPKDFDPYTVLQSGEFLKTLNIHTEWLVDGLIPANSITLIVGKSGIGKSTISTQIGDCVSKGINF